MILRRVLVPASVTLHELHGVIQAIMGWKCLLLFRFKIRRMAYGSFDPMVEDPGGFLESFSCHKNHKLAYIYDIGAWWEHEPRAEDRLEAVAGKRYPTRISNSGACPPEDGGGPEVFLARRDEASGYDAWQDASTIVQYLDDVHSVETYDPSIEAFRKRVGEFRTYITNNAMMIPNYAERHRYGERVSTGFVESNVNTTVGKHFAKSQQMRWSKKGAHLLLHTPTRALDGTQRKKF